LPKPLRRLYQKWHRLGEVVGLCHRAESRWHLSLPITASRAWHLCKTERFEPIEAFRLGLFGRDRGHEPSRYVSRKRLTKAQEALNPAGWACLLKNKDLFYRHCTALGVPIPQLYAVLQSPAPGWSYTHRPIRTREDWEAFSKNDLPTEIAVKPAIGAYGRGFNLFSRADGKYVDARQTCLEAGALYDAFASPEGNRYVIQERLHSHADLVRLSDTEALQTVRMITLVDSRGDAHLLHAHLKIIEADEIVDTFIDGLTGNIEAPVDLASGRLKVANRIGGTGAGVIAVATHPKTNVPFAGVALPFWSEACALVRRTALLFLPVRTVGWDVALTPDGPAIVEGNVWWDPPNQHGTMPALLRQLEGQDSPR